MSLISDAGTPSLSDPGKLLIKKCFENKINVIPIPGVSSITASMSVSGFKDQFFVLWLFTQEGEGIKACLN